MVEAKKCNKCGKSLDMIESINTGHIEIPFFYGSKRDGDKMIISLCSECYDKLIDSFAESCEIKPEVKEFLKRI